MSKKIKVFYDGKCNICKREINFYSKIDKDKIYLVEANESEKSYRRCADHIENLILLGLKRGHTVAAIGGGVIRMDIVNQLILFTQRIAGNIVPTVQPATPDDLGIINLYGIFITGS